MSGGGLTTASSGMPAFGPPMTLEQSELQTKEIMDWAGLTSLEKLRAASTETIYTVGSMYSRSYRETRPNDRLSYR